VRRLHALVTAGSFLLLTSAAYAAEAEKALPPQIDFANPLTKSQVVWLFIIFFALYLLLDRWALPQVGEVLEARSARIAADLNAARAAKAQSDSAVAELTAATRKAQAEALAEISGAVDAAKADAAAQAATANARLEKQLADAETRINAARAASVGALRDVAKTTTADVVSRLAGFAPDNAVVENAVDRALAARAA
jgi:F-type H+-transporting ATPase subunit b